MERMKAQAKLHHEIPERNKVEFEGKYRKMLNEIEKISSVHVRQHLKELCRNDCKKEKEKPQNLWEERKVGLKNSSAAEEMYKILPTQRMQHLPRQQTKLRDAKSAENKQTAKQQLPQKEKSILQ